MAKDNKSNRPRFAKIVGNPQDAKGLYCAMRRFVEHRAVQGSTESGLYSIERYLRDFIEWADARSVTHPEHVSCRARTLPALLALLPQERWCSL